MGSRADQHHVRHAILAVAPDAARQHPEKPKADPKWRTVDINLADQ